MRLELGRICVKGARFGDSTKMEKGILVVNRQEVESLALEDERIKEVKIEIALPGEKTRVTPVKDVVEPRVKISGPGGIFPGVLAKVDVVGSGRTNALSGAAVITCGKIVGFQEGIIDMSGPGADYTPFSQTCNVCLVIEPKDGLSQYEYEAAARMAGFKVAAYLGDKAARGEPDSVEVYETKPLFEAAAELPGLPKVGYVYMLQTQGLLHDTYVYGVDGKKIVPTILYPTEVMDGAIVSGNCVSACDKNTT
ncbi:MAG: glycine/sarcosine/betaine reductase component B subunit, partial [Treponema sp.]|nr:glycine/sarcosine/betaine reductase component B subunit [Treponema sp.]